jgi:senataxin
METDNLEDILEKWYREFDRIPAEHHLLCPKVDDDDLENYDNDSTLPDGITAEEKSRRIKEGRRRLEIAYWNTLLFAYDKDKAGIWLIKYSQRLTSCLENCDKCVLNWHMGRKAALQRFSECVGCIH